MPGELRFSGDAARAREPGFITQAREMLHLPQDAALAFERTIKHPQGGHTVEYTVTAPFTLDGTEFGPADGVSVDERATARLSFDARGVLVSSEVSPADPRYLHLVKDQVKKLAAAGEIAAHATSQPDESKPWYVETDPKGRKRLKRALIK